MGKKALCFFTQYWDMKLTVTIRRVWVALWLIVCLHYSFAGAKTFTVKPNESIAEAIKKANAGDTLLIERGLYKENLLIDKPLTLKGINRPTIDGQLQGDVIRITATDVVIQGIIVVNSGGDMGDQNAGIYIYPGSDRAKVLDCDISYSLFGLWIEESNDVEINGNLITGKRDFRSAQRGNGIQLYYTYRAQILNNRISFARDGIYVDVSYNARFAGNKIHNSRYGTHYMTSNDNIWENNESYNNRGGLALMEVRNQIVRNNRAWGNTDHGIMLRTIQDSVVENNVVSDNTRGFFIYDAEYNEIKDNLIIKNVVGVHLSAGSINNVVENNAFISNRQQIRYVANRDVDWPKNFWSNYTGWDRDGDGMGDIPYVANDLVDRITWKIPMVKLLLNSPAIQALRVIDQQFPVLKVPSVLDKTPLMMPSHPKWRAWTGESHD